MSKRTGRESVERLAELDNYEKSLREDGSNSAQAAIVGLQDLKAELTEEVFGPGGRLSQEGSEKKDQ